MDVELPLPEQPAPPSDRGRRFVITVESMESSIPVEIRLRHLLKAALRSQHLRCLSIEEVAEALTR